MSFEDETPDYSDEDLVAMMERAICERCKHDVIFDTVEAFMKGLNSGYCERCQIDIEDEERETFERDHGPK